MSSRPKPNTKHSAVATKIGKDNLMEKLSSVIAALSVAAAASGRHKEQTLKRSIEYSRLNKFSLI